MSCIIKLMAAVICLTCLAACDGDDNNITQAAHIASDSFATGKPARKLTSIDGSFNGSIPILRGVFSDPGAVPEATPGTRSANMSVVTSGVVRAEAPPNNLKSERRNYEAMVYQNIFGVQATQSRNDSLVGSRRSGEGLAMRLAYFERWGNPWSGMKIGAGVLTNLFGVGKRQRVILPAGERYRSKEWYSEMSVQYVLTFINRIAGFERISKTLESEYFLNGVPVSVINYFLAALGERALEVSIIRAELSGEDSVLNEVFGVGGLDGTGLNWKNSVLSAYKLYLMKDVLSEFCPSSKCWVLSEFARVQYIRTFVMEATECSILSSEVKLGTLVCRSGRVSEFRSRMSGAVLDVILAPGDAVLVLCDS